MGYVFLTGTLVIIICRFSVHDRYPVFPVFSGSQVLSDQSTAANPTINDGCGLITNDRCIVLVHKASKSVEPAEKSAAFKHLLLTTE